MKTPKWLNKLLCIHKYEEVPNPELEERIKDYILTAEEGGYLIVCRHYKCEKCGTEVYAQELIL